MKRRYCSLLAITETAAQKLGYKNLEQVTMNPTLTNLQRFRISLMARYLKKDIDVLAAVEDVRNNLYAYSS